MSLPFVGRRCTGFDFVSGLLILTTRSFQLGERPVVGETEGAVERIRLRATEIRTYEGRLVLVPNSELLPRITSSLLLPPSRRRRVECSARPSRVPSPPAFETSSRSGSKRTGDA